MRADITNISGCKKCVKKLCNVWICMPPIGTYIINKLEQPELAKALKGFKCIEGSNKYVITCGQYMKIY